MSSAFSVIPIRHCGKDDGYEYSAWHSHLKGTAGAYTRLNSIVELTDGRNSDSQTERIRPSPITDAIVTDDRPSEPMDAPIALR